MSRRIAVFASGNGSNLQAIIDAIQAKALNATLAVVVCDVPNAHALTRATNVSIDTLVLTPISKESRDAFAERIVTALAPFKIELICLAGFMRIIGKPLLTAYSNRIINIHPSLLPQYPGLHSIERAFSDHVPETGCTIHFVDDGMDTGPVIAQSRVPILANDTLETLTNRMHAAEHALYPQTIQKVLDQLSAA